MAAREDGSSRIAGVELFPYLSHRDARGFVAEVFRHDRLSAVFPQWHVLATNAGAFRGMHVHARHDDYKIVVEGRAVLALKDLRPGSPTEGRVESFELGAEELRGVFIPRGVAHGVLALTWSVVLVGVSQLYDPGDEFEFRWDDPEAGISLPAAPIVLSDRDEHSPALADLLGKSDFLTRLAAAPAHATSGAGA
jgi:dTDP-4-dehydrorhamnose 3,5-epimerase